MGYLRPLEVDVLALPSDPTYSVTMKRRATYGDIESARSAMMKLDAGPAGVVTEVEWKAYIQTLLTALIVDWNLTDESDHPMQVSVESIAKLTSEDGDFLVLEAQRRSAARPVEKEIPFVSPSPVS